jgi:hypothetical protein
MCASAAARVDHATRLARVLDRALEGDTLVVETKGFNDKTWLDDEGHPHSDALTTTERFHRVDVGTLDLEITFNDPQYYAKPWTTHERLALMPDTDLIEDVCDNEKDNAHTSR